MEEVQRDRDKDRRGWAEEQIAFTCMEWMIMGELGLWESFYLEKLICGGGEIGFQWIFHVWWEKL